MSVKDEIVGIIDQICRPQKLDLSDETKPLVHLGLDSLDYSSVLLALEDRYDVTIGEAEIEQLASLGDLVAFVEKQAAASGANR